MSAFGLKSVTNRQLQRLWDRYLQPAFRKLGIDVRRYDPNRIPTTPVIALLERIETLSVDPLGTKPNDIRDFLVYCARNFEMSSAQALQDLFVLHQLQFMRSGFFVEFGATDGRSISNTRLLEERYGWDGILAEPARCWHEPLRTNRSCTLDFRCVWTHSGDRVQFNEVASPELSTIDQFSSQDLHAKARESGNVYSVETVSLADLLRQHGAPARIDYLSIDTEGSELSILEAFDFRSYDVRVITVEHNYTPNRAKIHRLLCEHGYHRKFEELSRWDDWYVRA